jgi:hypothetical protein
MPALKSEAAQFSGLCHSTELLRKFRSYKYTARQSKLEVAMSMLGDLWSFLKERKKWWLLPVIAVLLFFGIMIVFASGSAIAPFIYTLF